MTHTLYGPSGSPLFDPESAALYLPGEVDTFNRADGPLGDAWTDASDVFGSDIFDPLQIVDQEVIFEARWPNVYDTVAEEDTPFLVSHFLAVRDIGMSDNFEVGIEFRGVDLDDLVGQWGPCALVDLEADSREMGVTPLWDIAVNWASYIQNVFRTEVDQSDVFDNVSENDYYERLGGTLLPPPKVPLPGLTTVALRVVDGTMTYAFGGESRANEGNAGARAGVFEPTPLPDWDGVESRTWAGFHVIWAGWKPTEPSIVQTPFATNPHRGHITRWWWRPCTRHFI